MEPEAEASSTDDTFIPNMMLGPLSKSPRIDTNSNTFGCRILNWQKSLNTRSSGPLLLLISVPSVIKEPIKTSKKWAEKSKLMLT